MGDIKAFLQPPVMDETREVVISERFKGADGEPVPFIIRSIDQETNEKLIRQATIRKKMNGQILQELNNDKYAKLLISACVVEPDFRNADLCAYYKTVNPLDVPGRMLSVGEYSKLVKEIQEMNDIVTSDEEMDALEDEAKN